MGTALLPAPAEMNPVETKMKFACGRGHVLMAWDKDQEKDLTGYFCPLCLGAIVGHGELIDSRILAPVQEAYETYSKD